MQKAKRGSTCENGGVDGAEYDLVLHVIALFIIFFVSSFACGFPMLALKFPRLHIPQSFLFAIRHFGTGVLIATAFVHLLPTAFVSLGNPCLSGFWTTDYPAMPGAIALAAVFFVAVIEMIFSPAQHVCGGSKDLEKIVCREMPSNRQTPPGDDSKLTNTPDDVSRSLSRHDKEPQIVRETAESLQPDRSSSQRAADIEHAEEGSDSAFTPIILSPEQRRQKAFMQCILLEIGILFHSVFIGMALSVTIGSTFIVLLIAIAFHRKYFNPLSYMVWSNIKYVYIQKASRD